MLSKNNIVEILKKEQPFLKNHFGVKRVAIFGSYGTDTASKNSDVDIYIEFERSLGLKFIQLSDYLENKLEKKTDILTPGGLESIRVKKVVESIKRSLIYV